MSFNLDTQAVTRLPGSALTDGSTGSRACLAITDDGRYLFQVGGSVSNQSPLRDISIYDSLTESMLSGPLPLLTYARWQHTCNVVNGFLYAFGGSGGTEIERLDISDMNTIASKSWEIIPGAMSSPPESGMRSIVFESDIYYYHSSTVCERIDTATGLVYTDRPSALPFDYGCLAKKDENSLFVGPPNQNTVYLVSCCQETDAATSTSIEPTLNPVDLSTSPSPSISLPITSDPTTTDRNIFNDTQLTESMTTAFPTAVLVTATAAIAAVHSSTAVDNAENPETINAIERLLLISVLAALICIICSLLACSICFISWHKSNANKVIKEESTVQPIKVRREESTGRTWTARGTQSQGHNIEVGELSERSESESESCSDGLWKQKTSIYSTHGNTPEESTNGGPDRPIQCCTDCKFSRPGQVYAGNGLFYCDECWSCY